jgi:hypothetical protein
MMSRTIFEKFSMGGVEEGTITTMEVDSIVAEVATESTQIAPDTIEAIIEIVHPSTLSTIIEIEEGIENPQMGDGTGVVPMVE